MMVSRNTAEILANMSGQAQRFVTHVGMDLQPYKSSILITETWNTNTLT